jgi:copper resistance protein D
MPDGAVPAFDLGGGGISLALVQGLSVAALFSGFGSLLFLAAVAPPALARMAAPEGAVVADRCRALARVALLLAILAEFAWLWLEAATLSDADGAVQAAGAIPVVVADTEFGHLIVAQVLLLAASVLLSGRGLRIAAVSSGAAVVLQAWHLHAAAMYDGPSILLVCEVMHVVAAGAWLGGLLPLAIFVRAADPPAAAVASRRFAPLGLACVLVLAGTALWQGWVLVGGPRGLVGTAYGWMVLVKLALFAALIGFACRNHFRLTPALLGGGSVAAARRLRASILREAAVGLLIVLAAAVLASLPPGMRMSGLASPAPVLGCGVADRLAGTA